MNTLQLFIDAAWPEHHADCAWQLLNETGRLIESGRSEPIHWPGVVSPGRAAPRPVEPVQAQPICQLILSSDQAVLLKVNLPAGSAGRQREVIAFALEDRLLEDADHYHLALGAHHSDGRTDVVAIARQRLRTLTASLATAGIVPQSACVEAQCAPRATGTWLLLAQHDQITLVTDDGWLPVRALERQPPPDELLIALATTGGERCTAVQLAGDAASLCDTTAWRAALNLPVTQAAGIDNRLAPATAINLLQGEWAPPRAQHPFWRGQRLALRFGAVALAAYALFSLGEWAWLARESSQLKAQQTALFRETFPQTASVVMPPLQLRRSLDAERHRRGLTGEEDFLALTAALAEAGIGKTEELRYGHGKLDAVAILPTAAAIDPLRRALRLRGITLEVGQNTPLPDNQGVRISLALRKGFLP